MKYRSGNSLFRTTLALLLCAALLLAGIPVGVAAAPSPVQSGDLLLATMSDPHYYPTVLAADTDEFREAMLMSNLHYDTLGYILDTALETLASDAIGKGLKYLVLSGDLTLNGERQGHEELAARLAAFEKDTGVQVFVTNGNHDINNYSAASYSHVPAEITSPQDFLRIYYDLGFSDAYHTFIDYKGENAPLDVPSKAGMLTYSVRLDDGYRLIMLDAGHYSADVTEDGRDEHETSGGLTPELLAWLLAEIEDAKAQGETPICSTHWNISGINYLHEYVLTGFVMDNAYQLQELLADAGLHYIFSGHQHTSDIDITYSDAGEPMYSIITPTLTEYPAAFRETYFSCDKQTGAITATFDTVEINGTPVKEIKAAAPAQSVPFSQSVFRNQFAQSDATLYLTRMLKALLKSFSGQIAELGGIVPLIESLANFSIEKWLDDLFYGGLGWEGVDIFTAKNVMSLLGDIDAQLTGMLLDDLDKTCDELLYPVIQGLCETVITDVPCTKFIDSLGFGSTEQGGTVGDIVLSVMYYMYAGNEDISDDPFVLSVLARCLSGEITPVLVDALRTYVVEDFLLEQVLANINVHLSALFVNHAYNVSPLFDSMYLVLTSMVKNGVFDELVQSITDETISFTVVMRALYNMLVSFANLNGDMSYLFLAEKILSFANLKYGSSIDEVLDYLLDSFVLVDNMQEGVGYVLWKIINGCVTDEEKDNNVTYVYDGAVAVEPTADDLQLPSLINVTLGTDAATSCVVNWFTKYSVTGTDIEIYEADTEPVFTGTPAAPANIDVNAYGTSVTRSFKGVDVGAFGVMTNELEVVRHVAELSNLKPATTYYYRIGDAEKGFWSRTGRLTTAAGGTEGFTFLHMTDTQSITPTQYGAWAGLLADALALYPDTAFIAHTGDFVDHGDSFTQWKWGLDAAADSLMNVALMPTSGNHEAYGAYAMENYFAFAQERLPVQYSDLGAYYSYDYNNAHFIVLNTNATNDDGTLSDAQVAWLKKDAAATDADWVILEMHESIFSQGMHYDEDGIAALRKQLLKLMLDFNIDIVLSGHDHVYLRTNFVDHYGRRPKPEKVTVLDRYGNSFEAGIDPEGSAFICGGTGGVKFYEPAPEGATIPYFSNSYYAYPITDAEQIRTAMFSAISIEDNKLTLAAYCYDQDGTLRRTDSMAILKTKLTFISGDADLDGVLTASDARTALRFAVGLDIEEAYGLPYAAADFDANGDVDAADARHILRCAVGLDPDRITTRTLYKKDLPK